MSNFIGHRLKFLRKSKSWSQEQTADYLCISQSAYARMEKGVSQSWASSLNKICEVFEITPQELFQHEDSAPCQSQQKDTLENACMFYQLSKKLLEQYEDRLKEKDEIIMMLLNDKL